MSKTKVAFFVFVLASMLDIVGIIFSIQLLVYIFKPLIIFSLLFLYVFSLPKRNKWYVIALELSFIGDVLLMFTGKLFFISGLVSFLLAHILFIKIVLSRIKKVNFSKLIISVTPFLGAFILLIFTLKDDLHEMLWPVIIYGLTISTFGVISLLDYMNTKSKESMFMFFGAITFMISDSILAINKFYNPAHILEVIVMTTYVFAQFFIFKSMILSFKESKLK